MKGFYEGIKKSKQNCCSNNLFLTDSLESVKIPVGTDDKEEPVSIILGEGFSKHGLIVGPAGSGKSTLLHTIIMSSMLHYSPDQLHLYLLDFCGGTEFNVYASGMIPHIQMTALAPTQERGEELLEELTSEMERRFSLFVETRQDDFTGYRKETGGKLPRILVIMDEIYGLFLDSMHGDRARNCAMLIEKLVVHGHAAGIHLLMTTQSTDWIETGIMNRIAERINLRIGLWPGTRDAGYLFPNLHDANIFRMMKRSIGTAVMNMDYMRRSGVYFHIAYCDLKTQQELLELLSSSNQII